MDILAKIKKMQKDRGWSIYRLSQEAGLTQSTLSNMFKRGTNPSISTLQGLCSAFGVSLEELFHDENGIESNTLSLDETKLIRSYRKLSPGKKESVRNLLDLGEDK